MVLRGAKELSWLRSFQIGITLDVLVTLLKSGDFRGPLKEDKGGPLRRIKGAP